MAYNKETGMYEGFIYKIWNDVNDKLYVGQTSRTIETRFKDHILSANNSKDTTDFHIAIREIGKEYFHIDEIDKIVANSYQECRHKLDVAEIDYINLYNCIKPNGYNMQNGGQGGDCIPVDYYDYYGNLISCFSSMTEASEYTFASMSSIYNNCEGITYGSKYGIFRYHSDPFDKFESIYREDGKIQIYKYDIFTDQIIGKYESETFYGKVYGHNKKYVCNLVNNHIVIDGKYVLFKSSEEYDISIITFPKIRYVEKYDLSNHYIATYNSASDAARNNQTDSSSISKCCRGIYKHVKGFIYRYVDFEKKFKEVKYA